MNSPTGIDDSGLVEGAARVVAIDGTVAWLEPEAVGGCGGCASASSCGAASLARASGFGTIARRLRARRFPLELARAAEPLAVGDRIAVGIADDALAAAALTAYALPLAVMLAAGGLAQAAFGRDAATSAAMALGLVLGLAVARRLGERPAARARCAPRLLRRLGDGRPDSTAP